MDRFGNSLEHMGIVPGPDHKDIQEEIKADLVWDYFNDQSLVPELEDAIEDIHEQHGYIDSELIQVIYNQVFIGGIE